MARKRKQPLAGALPERYVDADWVPPNRQDEVDALRWATPRQVVSILSSGLSAERRARIDASVAARLSGVVVVLEDLHDPHNGGAVLRSCEAMGLREVHIIEQREKFRVSRRLTQGSDKWLDVVRHPQTSTCLSSLKARGFVTYAAVPGATRTLEDLDPRVPAAFLMGNEHAGLSAEARALADVEVAIPLYGLSESLNLSVATAIMVYTHATRRRTALGRTSDLTDEQALELTARYYARDIRASAAWVQRQITQEHATHS